MTWLQAFTLACQVSALVALSLTLYWLRRAGQYNRITRKLRTGEHLTRKERAMLDRARLFSCPPRARVGGH